MNRFIKLFSIFIFITNYGCDGREVAPENSAADSRADACQISLTPYPGKQAEDQTIARWQARSKAGLSVGILEKLGWAYVAKARSSFDPGFYKLAEQTALCIRQTNPEHPAGKLLQGHVFHQLHRFQQAESIGQQLVRQRGAWFDFALLGDALMEQGKIGPAVRAYQMMMDQRPGPQAYARAAHIRWLTGDLPGAIALMALTVDSGAGGREARAWANVEWARLLLLAEKPSEALAILEKTRRIQPDYPPALLLQSKVLLSQDQPKAALPLLQQAARLNPLPEVLWTLAEGFALTGQTASARKVEDQLMATGSREDRRTFALYLASSGIDPSRALQMARQELTLRHDVFTRDTLAWALYAGGDLKQARRIHQQVMAQGTIDARLFYHAGILAAAEGDMPAAKRWLERAQALKALLLPSEYLHLHQVLTSMTASSHPRRLPSPILSTHLEVSPS